MTDSFLCKSKRSWCTAASCCFIRCRLSFSLRRSSSSLAARHWDAKHERWSEINGENLRGGGVQSDYHHSYRRTDICLTILALQIFFIRGGSWLWRLSIKRGNPIDSAHRAQPVVHLSVGRSLFAPPGTLDGGEGCSKTNYNRPMPWLPTHIPCTSYMKSYYRDKECSHWSVYGNSTMFR